MSKRMLIDATHAEETRVVVLDGNRLEDFDIETSTKKQLKGNIYLAKVVRVEPSLQAAFVEYGGNRHGFLAFSEIHPDYYQIPVADRQRLLELQAEQARLEEEEEDLELALNQAAAEPAPPPPQAPPPSEPGLDANRADASWADASLPPLIVADTGPGPAAVPPPAPEPWASAALPLLIAPPPVLTAAEPPKDAEPTDAEPTDEQGSPEDMFADDEQPESGDDLDMFGSIPEQAPPETMGGGDLDVDTDDETSDSDERRERRIPPRFLRNYHIQEVIHRRQILLVQVVKEERGTKGAALTTYLSLAGRFSVLMPNSPRGGGISRKITSASDRRRLKEIMNEVDLPKGMGLIVRTAGAQRPKPEIRRDCEYLLRLWDDIREHTLKSIAPALIYEEASLIKRAIRDVYSRDVDDITVDGEEGWRAAHEFMRMLMPSHARKVLLWPDQGQSLFARFQVEAQLDAMLQPTVQLRSGGYLVINQAEALVAIDVNSGRSTRERNVEETATRTNLEAADEVARQVRLRDLAGLIVIDFIDMESKRHNAMVERRLKEALKDDRARIQVGHISHFGLLEMSRQRLRPSLEETTLIVCPHCNGTGHVRGTESAALHVLRGLEEEAGKRRSAEVIVHVATPIALYILNHKRERLNEIERRYGMRVIVAADDSLLSPKFRIDRVRTFAPGEEPRFVTPDAPRPALAPPRDASPLAAEPDDEAFDKEADADDVAVDAQEGLAGGSDESRDAEQRRKRRRRRRGRTGRDEEPRAPDDGLEAEPAAAAFEPVAERPEPEAPMAETEDEAAARRRGRRNRRRGRDRDGEFSPLGVPGAEQPDLIPVYTGPTPADPFGGGVFDIFDVMEQAELATSPPRRPQNNRGRDRRPRWNPPAWAVASHPPMLVEEGTEPDGRAEPWALPNRPFMLRRDRHAPRWGQNRGGPRTDPHPVPIEAGPPPAAEALVPAAAPPAAIPPAAIPPAEIPLAVIPLAVIPLAATPLAAALATPLPAAPLTPVPPTEPVQESLVFPPAPTFPPAPDFPPAPTFPPAPDFPPAPAFPPAPDFPPAPAFPADPPAVADLTENSWAEPALPPLIAGLADTAPAPAARPEPAAAVTDNPAEQVPETPLAAAAEPAPPPVPANDTPPAPVIQPIIVGSESAPPAERKRCWWRRF